MDDVQKASHVTSNWRYGVATMEPLGPIGLIIQQIQPSLADAVNLKLRQLRENRVRKHPELGEEVGYLRNDYRIEAELSRFHSGEGYGVILDTVRGHDLFIIADVLNHGVYQTRFNQLLPLSADEQYSDLVRLIAAAHGLSRRINVIMPYLYEGRRYTRNNRASMDCAIMLKELFRLGVNNFITFDAHDGRVANAVPCNNFENFPTTAAILRKVLLTLPQASLDKEHFMVISPKETGISRAIYYATLLHVPLGTFYRIHNGDGSISISFLGDSLEGRDVLIVDDIIDSGETLLQTARYLKDHGASHIYAVASFPLFTNGYNQAVKAYEEGYLDRVFATNLIYLPRALREMPWFEVVDMSSEIAAIIDALNHDASLSGLLSPERELSQMINAHRLGQIGE